MACSTKATRMWSGMAETDATKPPAESVDNLGSSMTEVFIIRLIIGSQALVNAEQTGFGVVQSERLQ